MRLFFINFLPKKALLIKRRYTYNKTQKLKSSKQIGTLLSEGKVIKCFPLRAVYRMNNEETGLQAGMGVSKRKFKKATDRNRVKRLMREGWRLNSAGLREELEQRKLKVQVFILFVHNEMPDFNEIERRMKIIVEKLVTALG